MSLSKQSVDSKSVSNDGNDSQPSKRPKMLPTCGCASRVYYSPSICSTIADSYTADAEKDVCLVVGGKDYHAHKLVLNASSDVFRVMLSDPNWADKSQDSRITLTESPECFDVFDDFLAHLYTGCTEISPITVVPLMTLADKYNTQELMEHCKKFMLENIPTAARYSQLMSWLKYSSSSGNQEIADACRDYIKNNFEHVAAGEDFTIWEVDLLISFMKLDDLVVPEEWDVFQCVARWVEAQEDQSKALVEQVFSYVRFPMMPMIYLMLHLRECLVTALHKDFFHERVSDALEFNTKAGAEGNLSKDLLLCISSNSHLFTPRLYTSKRCGDVYIFKLPTFQDYHVHRSVFDTPVTCHELEGDFYDWTVNVSPKGVALKDGKQVVWEDDSMKEFQAFLRRARREDKEIPDTFLRTVRLSLRYKDSRVAKVRVAILVYATQGGVEHVKSVKVTNFVFSGEERVLCYDDLIPYDDLHPEAGPSPYLVGKEGYKFLKIKIIILPVDVLFEGRSCSAPDL